jgi:hypothetical protein
MNGRRRGVGEEEGRRRRWRPRGGQKIVKEAEQIAPRQVLSAVVVGGADGGRPGNHREGQLTTDDDGGGGRKLCTGTIGGGGEKVKGMFVFEECCANYDSGDNMREMMMGRTCWRIGLD